MTNELADAWGAMHPAHCKNCHAAFLVPPQAGAPNCPNCFAARLEPMPALQADAPPELVIPFAVSDATLNANLERWLREIPFKPASLNLRALQKNLVRVFLPMYLADARAYGTWTSQMGFDYLVASSEERFDGTSWVTQRLNETRVRWEPRAGELTRAYENLPAPASEAHARWMIALGATDWREPPFDSLRALAFAADTLGNAIVQAPDLAPNAAWQFARAQLERRAARECETAANAQHHEKFELRAAYGEPRWTLLLLPTYVTSYSDDGGKWIPVRVNGQSGFVNGVKRASMQRARSWSIALGAAALGAFLLTALLGVAGALYDAFLPALFVLGVTFLLCLAAPVPLLRAWQFNRQQAAK